jgi:protein-S-isoprenylcysteine O-methyltransferase Ste14
MRAAVRAVIAGIVLAAIFLGVSGRTDWTRAWIYVGINIALTILAGVWLRRVSPGLLEERSRLQKGTKNWDKLLAPLVAIVGPVATWLVAALDARWNWPVPVPAAWSAAALVVCEAGWAFTFWAMLTNRFFASTVRIQNDRGHHVIDGGPYRFVRHPGYTGAALFTLATPVALGSWQALIPAAATVAVLVLRTALEDRTLQRELEGYREFASRTRYRLIPGLW